MADRTAYWIEYRAKNKDKLRERDRRYRESHREHIRAYNAEYRKKNGNKRQRELREYINSHKKECLECGEKDKRVLQFHHRKPEEKLFEVSQARSYESAREEMKKCDVLCFNCHMKKHLGERVKCPTCGTIVRSNVLH